jgi:hypothetical protein
MNIPQLRFKTKVDFHALTTLEKIKVPASLDAIYDPRYRFTRRLFKEDIETIENLFLKTPAARFVF